MARDGGEGAQDADRQPDGDQPRGQDDDDRHEAGEEVARLPLDHEDLESDEDEEHGVEDLVDQFPEEVEMLAGVLRHRKGAAVVADEEPGDDHGDGPGDVEMFGQGIAASDQGEGNEDFDLILIDTLEHVVGDQADDHAEYDATDGLAQEDQRDVGDAWGVGGMRPHARGDAEQCEEDDDTDAVVEEGLAADLRFEIFRCAQALHDRQDRDRVGG